MFRIISSSLILFSLLSLCYPQQKIDFRTVEEQAKDPNIALKRSIIYTGLGQLYNEQNIK